MICFLMGLAFNVRYFSDFLLKGYLASGHDYNEDDFEVHGDHWHIFCRRWGAMAATDIYPPKIKERADNAEKEHRHRSNNKSA